MHTLLVQSVMSVLESEFLGPVSRVVAPGLVVTLSLGIAVDVADPLIPELLTNQLIYFGTIGALVLIFGMTVDALGSHLEVMWDHSLEHSEKTRKRRGIAGSEFVRRDWFDYLRLRFQKECEPVGHRYIRTRVLQLKFELNAGVAFLIGAAIVFITNIFSPGLPDWASEFVPYLLGTVGVIVMATYAYMRTELGRRHWAKAFDVLYPEAALVSIFLWLWTTFLLAWNSTGIEATRGWMAFCGFLLGLLLVAEARETQGVLVAARHEMLQKYRTIT